MTSKDNIHIDHDNRIIYFSDDVWHDTVGIACATLLSIIGSDNKKDEEQKDYKREPIKLYIHSYGGEVYDMWGLIDIIRESKTPIYTYCTGYAMSAGFKIFLAGHKRFCTKHATFMYHQMGCYRSGKYQDLVEDREEMDYLNKQNEDYVLERTKITRGYIDEVRQKKKDVYIHAEEALKLGIVDEIIV